MKVSLLIDFGSTNTKVVAVDLENERVLDVAQSPSTVDTDIMSGLRNAVAKLRTDDEPLNENLVERRLACSSAAGGLKLVAIGLVPELTLEAARMAALGAGAKVVGSYSYEITQEELEGIRKAQCDIILLGGGTDGGNREVVTNNARTLADSSINVPIVVACNKSANSKVKSILESAGKYVVVSENVLPELDRLNEEPARSCIRELFLKRIVKAKGLDGAREYVGDVIMPTPMAVLNASRLLAEGAEGEVGLGELMVVEVGGATTNVHSVARGACQAGVLVKGLPEPYAKRTVEGDLGIRYNATTILELVGEDRLRRSTPAVAEHPGLTDAIRTLSRHVAFVPHTEKDYAVDVALARTAVEIATERHAGVLKEVYAISSVAYIQHGKDLSEVGKIIGTGGVFAYGRMPSFILEAAIFDRQKPMNLKPKSPQLYIDQRYILFAVGLLSEVFPAKALRIAKKYLTQV